MDWEDIRYFVALTRHGSLSATARALRVNHATVARRVGNLEQHIGKTLFDRGAEGYGLTTDGKALMEQALAMERAATSFARHVEGDEDQAGLVRLTAGRTLAEWFLVDRLYGLHQRHPLIDIELVGDMRVLSLARREADIALRFGAPKDSELAARRVGTVFFSLYVATRWQHEPDALTTLPVCGFDKEEVTIPEAVWLDQAFKGRRFAFRGSQASQAAACRAGFGIALLPNYLAGSDRQLVKIESPIPPLEREIWLLIRQDLKKLPRMRVVIDYLVDIFRQEREKFALPEGP